MAPMPRRERERQQHVRHVLDVAGEMFANRGFPKVTMKEIAQRAEFALGTVYSFFTGKRHLYQQVIEQKVNELVTSISSAMAGETDPRHVIERYIEAKLHFFFENLDFVRLYFVEMHGPPVYGERALSIALQDKYRALLESVSEAFEQGIADGTFAAVSPEALATAIDGQTSAFVFSWLRDVRPDSPEDEIRTVKQIFLNGALARPLDGDASGVGNKSKET